MMYAQHTLANLAGLDSFQMRWIYFRERDKYGALVRGIEAERARSTSKPVSFKTMYFQVLERRNDEWGGRVYQGKMFHPLTKQEMEQEWQNYLENNPKLALSL